MNYARFGLKLKEAEPRPLSGAVAFVGAVLALGALGYAFTWLALSLPERWWLWPNR